MGSHFTAQQTLEQAQAFYRGIKERVMNGRSPEQTKIMPGLSVIIGKTKAEAEEKYATLQTLFTP